MRLFRMLAACAALVAAAATPAHAADILNPPPRPLGFTSVQAPTVNWTRFYVGVDLAWAGASSFTTDFTGGSDSLRAKPGILVGGTVGFDHQFANKFVVGMYADLLIPVSGLDSNRSSVFAVPHFRSVTSQNERMRGYGDVMARLGYPFSGDRLLPYLSAGAAMAEVRNSMKFHSTGSPVVQTDSYAWRVGPAVGAGMIYAFTPKVHLDLSYVHAWLKESETDVRASGMNFGSKTHSANDLVTLKLTYALN